MLLRTGIFALAAVSLSACGGLQWPPPPQQSSNAPRPVATAAAPSQAASRTVTARDGETLYDIAKRTGATPRSIIDANNLQPPYRIASGQALVLPASRSHTVVRGDTLHGISRQYGIDSYELARLNNLQPPYNIRVDQRLTLPGGDARGGVEVVERTGGSGMPSVMPMPRSTVQVEEIKSAPMHAPVTVSSASPVVSSLPAPVSTAPASLPPLVSTPASEPVKDIASAPLPSSVGAAAHAPAAPVASVPVPVAAPQVAAPEVASVPASTPVERPAATQSASPNTAQESTQLASLPRSNAKPRPGGRFIWPLDGKLLSEYGPKGDGLHNDGINISAPKGAPVYASANGVVAYAGNEIRGFGNLLLIQHPDGWITAYAHNDRLLVKRGDKVNMGQQISTVGSTGNVTAPQLHFEIRRGKRAVDPLDQLGTQSARS